MKHQCRICKATFNQQKVRAEFVFGGGKDHKFWECEKCGLVYLYPYLTKGEEKQFYAQEFEKFMEDRSGSDRNWSGPDAHIKTNQDQVKRRWEFLKDYLHKGNDVLEIGCSSGFMLNDLRDRGMSVVGVEPSGGFGNYLTENGHENYLSIEELKRETPEKKFDVILHFFVLEHISDAVAFLNTQLELLKPGGYIIAEVPNVDDPLTSLYSIPAFERFYWSIAHHYYYNPKSLSPELVKLNCSKYFFRLDQRYDLSNHITWLQVGKPGGQGRFNHVFSKETLKSYKRDLINSELCDTFFIYIKK
jgi:2-polyprenyl-3-methyl-5-hydroxy-6-metoxy-1,4-benzoquinol methylase